MAVRLEEKQARTQDDLLRLARRRFLKGEGLDIPTLASELGISRATAYRWAGNVEELTGQVLVGLGRDIFERSIREAEGTGKERLIDIYSRGIRYTSAPPYRTWLQAQDPEKALRIVASKAGVTQAATIAQWDGLLRKACEAGDLELPVDPHTMAYAIVRMSESFLYADLIAGEEPDVEKAIEIFKLLLR